MARIYYLILLCIFVSISHAGFGTEVDSTKGIQPTTYALLISIGDYPLEPNWPTANSSEDISNLKSFINKFSPGAQINVLQDKNATRENILKAIDYITKNITPGNKVYIHFSGGGTQIVDDNGDELDQRDEAFMPYDAPSASKLRQALDENKKVDASKLIRDDQLESYLFQIRSKLGTAGQLLFSIDASNFGPTENTAAAAIGRGGFFAAEDKESIKLENSSPFIILTSCLERERSIFLTGKDESLSRSFSTALKTYADQTETSAPISYQEFFANFSIAFKKISPTQTPSMAGNLANTFVLSDHKKNTNRSVESTIKANSKLFILSVGISDYVGPYLFNNCDDDAKLFTRSVSKAFTRHSNNQIRSFELLNTAATKEAIIKAITTIALEANDNDVFAFFFAGFTNQPELTTDTYAETWFYPATGKQVSIDNRNGFLEKEVITLAELKRLFDYVKCDKQLLLTEAGPSKNFKREFVKSMIKTNPVIADIVKRNRVIVVPTSEGLDATNCKVTIPHGPGLYYLTQIQEKGTDLFDLFSEKKALRQNVIFRFNELQNQCGYPKYEYLSFFFEKEFVEDLQYYFAKDAKSSSISRGLDEAEEDRKIVPPIIKNKYALVIGCDKFQNWNPLDNALNDAKSIADTLTNLFDFKTKLLPNPTLSEIYKALYEYNNLLREDDQFLLYIAGHGYYDTTIYHDGFIVTNDSRSLTADTFLTSYIPFNQLRIITDNFKSKQVMVLLDVCFSGAFDNSEDMLSGNMNYNLASKLDNNAVNKKLQMTTRKYITAGSSTEKVPDNFNDGHSPFAWFLLDGLRRAAKEKKYLTSGMLFKYIQSYLEDTVPLQSGFGKDQLRLGSEFIFISK